jgi:Tfp pilus tip-associated adhesin PilY1
MPKRIYLMIICVMFVVLGTMGAQAADEDLWTITNPPDVLIVLDLSGSMDWPPQGDKATHYVQGTCDIDGPFYLSSGPGHERPCAYGDDPMNHDMYIPANQNCGTYTGGFYPVRDSTNAKACSRGSASNSRYGNTRPSYSDVTCSGPFYKTSRTGYETLCIRNYGNANPVWSSTSCGQPFYLSSAAGHDVRCKRIDIAKNAIFSILNDHNDDGLNQINDADVTSLGIRIGLMKFYNCLKGTETDYTRSNSCIKLAWPISGSAAVHDATPYANIFCNDSSCSPPNNDGTGEYGNIKTESPTGNPTYESVVRLQPKGGTPLQSSLKQAVRYLDTHKTTDPARECRLKSVIFITDGEDTLACSGDGSNSGPAQRRAPVHQAKELKDAGYDVWVIGFGGDMPQNLQNTLNWMAYYGGTRNKDAIQSGNTAAVTVSNSPCSSGTDPGPNYLSGYAFMATNPDELSNAIRSAITSILSGNYSFSAQAAVAAARVQEENFLYEASFEPRSSMGASKEPFWPGHLKKYSLNENTGALITPACWDAGAKLAAQSPSSRNMWTYKGSGMVSYSTATVSDADLNVSPLSTSNCGDRCKEIIGFYRGESTYNQEVVDGIIWKLGDLFHTNPVIVKTPSPFYYDPRQCGATAFASFRDSNLRTAADGKQLVLAGANDGQLHAFRAGASSSDCSTGGDEIWSFIPPNLLEKMGPIAHNSHADRSSLASHQLFVDGPLQVADVWLPGSDATGTVKQASEWKTIAVMALGGGGGNFLWSRCSSCYCPYDSTNPSAVRYSTDYSAGTPYYCGYYALDVTDSVTSSLPTLMWNLKPTTAQAAYLGEPWSKMQIGRAKIAGNERWVGFIGGGYGGSGNAGKGFFVVDLKDGTIIWSYTSANNALMDFPAPAAPAALDTDNDGFIDTVYMGDLGGNMWRFRLCPSDGVGCGGQSYDTSCSTTNWGASRLYAASAAERGASLGKNTSKQIFTQAVAAKDPAGYVWVYWGTGENNDPITRPEDTNDTKNRIYAVKENKTFSGTYTTSNLKNITSGVYCYSATTEGCTIADIQDGWYINLSTNALTTAGPGAHTITNPVGEKMISDPALFGGMLMFPTYLPQQGSDTACGQAGNSFVYKINYLTGSGMVDGGGRTDYLGVGVGSAVLVSYRPGYGAADIYATASGGAGTSTLTQQLGEAPSTSSMTNILYWKDRRLK